MCAYRRNDGEEEEQQQHPGAAADSRLERIHIVGLRLQRWPSIGGGARLSGLAGLSGILTSSALDRP